MRTFIRYHRILCFKIKNLIRLITRVDYYKDREIRNSKFIKISKRKKGRIQEV